MTTLVLSFRHRSLGSQNMVICLFKKWVENMRPVNVQHQIKTTSKHKDSCPSINIKLGEGSRYDLVLWHFVSCEGHYDYLTGIAKHNHSVSIIPSLNRISKLMSYLQKWTSYTLPSVLPLVMQGNEIHIDINYMRTTSPKKKKKGLWEFVNKK